MNIDTRGLMPYNIENTKAPVNAFIDNAGTGFLVVLTGNIMHMLGLSKKPVDQKIELLKEGIITGVG